MSVPGAHNEWLLAKDSRNGKIVHKLGTQVRPVDMQMYAGLRAFDVTVHCDKVTATCGAVTTEDQPSVAMALPQVLGRFADFLKGNPTETIIVRLSKVDSLDRDMEYWSSAVLAILKKSPVAPSIWVPRDQSSANLATLGDVRGKLVILRDWNGAATKDGRDLQTYGMDMHLHITPHSLFPRRLSTEPELYDRWTALKAQISQVSRTHAHAGSGEGAMTYATAYGGGGVSPSFAASGYISMEGMPLTTGLTAKADASGPKPDFMRGMCTKDVRPSYCTIYYTGLNFLLNDALGTTGSSRAFDNNPNMHGEKRLGIVMMDFPGDSLIKAVIEAN
jgi:1-phosphatidylinositol phosphodiesterase